MAFPSLLEEVGHTYKVRGQAERCAHSQEPLAAAPPVRPHSARSATFLQRFSGALPTSYTLCVYLFMSRGLFPNWKLPEAMGSIWFCPLLDSARGTCPWLLNKRTHRQ